MFLLKFSPFLASQEFYHKSTLKSRFEAGEAKGSRVERPNKFFFFENCIFRPLKVKILKKIDYIILKLDCFEKSVLI